MEKLTAEQTARQILGQFVSRSDDISRLTENCRNRDYWIQWNPSFTIGSQAAPETASVDDRCLRDIVQRFNAEGYFQVEPIIPAARLQRMRACIEMLRSAGWLPIFSYLYDDFWNFGGGMTQVLSAILGPGYRQLPHVWTHYVSPQRGASGWPPHKDGDQRPRRLSVWIPLSDATLDNGCMYLIPKNRTPKSVAEPDFAAKTYSFDEMAALLQQCRALPAQAGSVLGWDLDVIHWGSTCTGSGSPRVAISMGFVAAGVDLCADEMPLIDVDGQLPSFSERLRIIGQAILTYEKFDPVVARFRPLAEELFAAPVASRTAADNLAKNSRL